MTYKFSYCARGGINLLPGQKRLCALDTDETRDWNDWLEWREDAAWEKMLQGSEFTARCSSCGLGVVVGDLANQPWCKIIFTVLSPFRSSQKRITQPSVAHSTPFIGWIMRYLMGDTFPSLAREHRPLSLISQRLCAYYATMHYLFQFISFPDPLLSLIYNVHYFIRLSVDAARNGEKFAGNWAVCESIRRHRLCFLTGPKKLNLTPPVISAWDSTAKFSRDRISCVEIAFRHKNTASYGGEQKTRIFLAGLRCEKNKLRQWNVNLST